MSSLDYCRVFAAMIAAFVCAHPGCADTIQADPAFSTRFGISGGGPIRHLSIGPSGSVYIAGCFLDVLGTGNAHLARLGPDLSVDARFQAPKLEGGTLWDVAEQMDGRLVIAGDFTRVAGVTRPGVARLNVDGTLDATFVPPEPIDGAVRAIAIQPDGRILIGGSFRKAGAFLRPEVMRLNSDGSLDRDFAMEGARGGLVNALALLPDGRCYAGGSFNDIEVPGRNCLVRLLPDGRIDPAFTFRGSSSSAIFCLAVQPDGRLLVGCQNGTGNPSSLFRLLEDGTSDSTFSIGTGFNGDVTSIDVLEDGRIAVAGSFWNFQSTSCRAAAILRSDGTRDTAFSPSNLAVGSNRIVALSDGSLLVSVDNSERSAVVVLDQQARILRPLESALAPGRLVESARAPDGGWFVRGYFTHVDGKRQGTLARLNPDGTLDETFDSGDDLSTVIRAIAPTPDGGVIVLTEGGRLSVVRGGNYEPVPNAYFVRFNRNGSVDQAFQANQTKVIDGYDIAVQSDGCIVVCGQAWGTPSNGITRFNADGTLDETFRAGTGFDALPLVISVDPDNRILALGPFQTFNGTARRGIARLKADGSLDETFAPGAGLEGSADGIVRDSVGRYYVWGYLTTYDGAPCPQVIRIGANGARDTSFVFDPSPWAYVTQAAVGANDGLWLTGLREDGAWAVTEHSPNGEVRAGVTISRASGDPAVGTLAGDEAGTIVAGGGTQDFDQILSGRFARLTVLAAPRITQNPAGVAAAPGETVVLSVQAVGPGLTYQWFKDGVEVDGAHNRELRLTAVDWRHAGAYTVRVSNGFEETESAAAVVSGHAAAPTITTQPAVVTGEIGRPASLGVIARGTGPLSYQWRHFGTPIVGATSATLTLPALSVTDAGFYDVIVADGLSATVSNSGRLVVVPSVRVSTMTPDRGFQPVFELHGGSVGSIISAPDGSAYYVLSEGDGYGPVSSTRVTKLGPDGHEDRNFRPVGLRPQGASCGVVLPDGKILVGGRFTHVDGRPHAGVVRLNPDGTEDTSFGIADIGSVTAIGVQHDGRILLGYISTDSSGFVGRFNADGSADPSFDVPLGNYAYATSIRVQDDGRVVIAGSHGVSRFEVGGSQDTSFQISAAISAPCTIHDIDTTGRMLISQGTRLNRFLSDGTLDGAFAPVNSVNHSIRSVVTTPDGKLMVSGYFPDLRAHAVRVGSGGMIEAGYAPMGDPAYYHLNAIARMPGGDFLFGGDLESTGLAGRLSVIKVDGNLRRDQSFGVQLRTEASVLAIGITRDGKIVAGGNFTHVNGVRRNRIAQLHADGRLDLAFDPGSGFAHEVGAGTALAFVSDVKIDPLGRILVAGGFGEFDGAEQMRIARLNPDGSRDESFYSFRPGSDDSDMSPARKIALLPDGKIAVVGGFGEFDRSISPRIVRLGADGVRDLSFNIGTGFDYSAYAVQAANDGKIVIGGAFGNFNGTAIRTLARLLPSGALDVGFPQSTDLTGSVELIHTLADNRMVVTTGTVFRRLAPNGEADRGFETAANAISAVTSVVDDQNGALVVGGLSSPDTSVIAARVLPTGSHDATFTVDGYLGWSSSPSGSCLAWTDDGSLLAGRAWTTFIGFQGGGLIRLIDSRAPEIIEHPIGATAVPGGAVELRVQIAGASGTFQWFQNGVALPSATGSTLQLTGIGDTHLGTYTVRVSNSFGSVWSRPAVLSGGGSAPSITREPTTVATIAGSPVVLSVGAESDVSLRYQWQVCRSTSSSREYENIAGADDAELRLETAQIFDTGLYRVLVSSGFQTVASGPVTVTVSAHPGSNARLVNLSTRALDLTNDKLLIPGFVISGTGTKRMLIRAVGPGLHSVFGLSGALDDPQMSLMRNGAVIASNDDWGMSANVAEIVSTSARVGAFRLPEGSKDAVILVDLPPGAYTAPTVGASGGTGIALVELYEADAGTVSARLVNISNRGFVDIGDKIMIPGFVVSNEGPRTFLIRAVGPSLQTIFGLDGILVDPVLTIFSGGVPILQNDDWSAGPGAPDTAATATAVGAFALTAGSKDSAFVVTLPPGPYTAQATGKDDTTGIALVEVYLVP